MNKSLVHIGTTEVVSLPEIGIDNVPAKIDTGADSSAIWASNIAEIEGVLRFSLFGPSSPFYSGELIKSTSFKRVTIRNSFGHIEERFKVDLKIKMGDRVIKARMTLANRANNRFPILIGRRTLRGKFIVDASMKSAAKQGKILMLQGMQNQETDAYLGALKDKGLNIDGTNYDDLEFQLGGKSNRISIISTGNDLSNYGLVYFRTSHLSGYEDISSAVAQYLIPRGVDFVDRSVALSSVPEKLYQYVVLTDNKISVPETIYRSPSKMVWSFERLVADLGVPFVLKDIRGRKGKHNYLIETKTEFDRALREASDFSVKLLAQKFIPNDWIYRFITLGGQVGLVIKRGRDDANGHLYSTSRGSKVELIDAASLPRQLTNLAPMAAKLLKLQIAGVDLVQDKNTKLWYCLEVNKAPQLYSGSHIREKEAAVAKYLSQRLNG